MKKNGFTLAEVLITLAIIGVVAVMTIPNLMSNTTGAQTATSFKKFVSTMEEVNQIASAQYGYTFADMANNGNGPERGGFCSTIEALTSARCDSGSSLITFKDGAVFHYNIAGNQLTGVYDANGNKGPHQIAGVSHNTAVTDVNTKRDLDDLVNVTFGRNGWVETDGSLAEKIIHDEM